MYIIIPMAGESSRFFNAGYTIPKYMLPLGDETVFDKSVKTFQAYFNNAYFIFVVKKDKYDTFEFVNDHASLLGIKYFDVVALDEQTRGQAETVYKAIHQAGIEDTYSELVIFNIDTIRKNLVIPKGNFTSYFDAFYDINADPKKWSFCAVSSAFNCLIATAEKEKISNWCSTGLYIFGSVRLFCRVYAEAVELEDYNYNYYIAPLYNFLIPKNDEGISMKSSNLLLKCPMEDVEFAGVPEEYEALKIKYKIE